MSDAMSDDDTTTPSLAATPKSFGGEDDWWVGPARSAPANVIRQSAVFMATPSRPPQLTPLYRRGPALFAQCGRRIDASRTPGRNGTRDGGNHCESQDGDDDREWVVWCQAKEQGGGVLRDVY